MFNPSNSVSRVQKPVWRILPGMIRGLHFQPDGGDTPGGDSGGEPEDKPEDIPTVTMTLKEQQDLIAKRERLAADKATKVNAGLLKELQDKLAAFEKKAPEKKENTYTADDLQKVLDERDRVHGDKVKEMQTSLTALQNAKKDSAIVSAASKAKAIDPEIVLRMVRDSIALDETGNLSVIDSNGSPRLSPKRGQDMTIDELIEEFLSDKPYLRTGSNTGGTGSNTNNHKGQTVDVAKLALTDPLAALNYLNANPQ